MAACPPKFTFTRKVNPTKRTLQVFNQDNLPSNNENPGLDWSLVNTLDQDPTGKDYFPPPYDPNDPYRFNGDEEQPQVKKDADLHKQTAWAIARIRRMRVSNTIAYMLEDPKLQIKWSLSLNKYYSNVSLRYREVRLTSLLSSNHEAAYVAMVGIVLPPELVCEACKASNGPFQNCIVLPRYLNGACATCHYNSGGKRCSHRPDASKRVKINGLVKTCPPSVLPFILGTPIPASAPTATDSLAAPITTEKPSSVSPTGDMRAQSPATHKSPSPMPTTGNMLAPTSTTHKSPSPASTISDVPAPAPSTHESPSPTLPSLAFTTGDVPAPTPPTGDVLALALTKDEMSLSGTKSYLRKFT
ncbi:hypothetical protein F4819DRAFT_507778 [Hypoxylon fuscum]|nr:hypothetical protein F4819DRAFT_507778 [Hypoxylon fuscum]